MRVRWLGLIACFTPVVPQASNAATLTFAYTATVATLDVYGDTTYLPNSLAGLTIGQSISGFFTYDTSAPVAQYIGGAMYSYTANLYATGALTINLPATTISGSVTAFGYSSEVFKNNSGGGGIVVAGPDSDHVVAGTHEIYTDYSIDFYNSAVFNSLSLPTSLNLADFTSTSLSFQEDDFHNPTGMPGGAEYYNGYSQASFQLSSLTQINAVPEPSTWVMMLFGFAGIGFGLIAASQSQHCRLIEERQQLD